MAEFVDYIGDKAHPGDVIEDWLLDGYCEATDGCLVEADGTCPHGHPSWLNYLGLL